MDRRPAFKLFVPAFGAFYEPINESVRKSKICLYPDGFECARLINLISDEIYIAS